MFCDYCPISFFLSLEFPRSAIFNIPFFTKILPGLRSLNKLTSTCGVSCFGKNRNIRL